MPNVLMRLVSVDHNSDFMVWQLGNFNQDFVGGHDQVRMNNEWQFEITNAIWDRRDCVLQMIILLMEGINGDIILPNVS